MAGTYRFWKIVKKKDTRRKIAMKKKRKRSGAGAGVGVGEKEEPWNLISRAGKIK